LCISILAQRGLVCLTSAEAAYEIRGRPVPGLRGGAGFGVDLRERDRCRRLRGTVRVPTDRRDRHSSFQRDAGVFAAHRAAVDEPAAIWLVLGYSYAWPAGLKVRRQATAIARWPDHGARLALPGRRNRRNSRPGAKRRERPYIRRLRARRLGSVLGHRCQARPSRSISQLP
jgi:hypothetical protein